MSLYLHYVMQSCYTFYCVVRVERNTVKTMQKTYAGALSRESVLATINVRLPQSIKTDGEAVLAREGVSISQAVRNLYIYLGKQQKIPECIRGIGASAPEDKIANKRNVLRTLVGVLPSDISLEQARDERLAKHLRSGIQ